MKQKNNSYRQILRSSSIIGGASIVNIIVGLVRTKIAALLLGPAGIGLIGLLQSLMSVAATFSALGIGTVGTRQIAEAAGKSDQTAVSTARRALFWGMTVLAIAGSVLFWLLRHVLSDQVIGDKNRYSQVGWLAIGVALTVASGAQLALLNGLRRIEDLAWISVFSAFLATFIGAGALYYLGDNGIIFFILGGPLSTFMVGHWYVSRLSKVQTPHIPLVILVNHWSKLAKLGFAFMISGLVGVLGQLLVRSIVQRELGSDALGNFQAAWTVGMMYIGFVLGAMGTDYYPRLTATIHDHETASRLVNDQTEVAMLLAGPVFLMMQAIAPWVIDGLYSKAFHQAVIVLRWQIIGDILKVSSWPLGYILLAAGDGRTFMVSESLAIGIFVFITWVGLPFYGVNASGMGFLAMYAFLLPFVYWLAARKINFKWRSGILKLLVFLILANGFVFAISVFSDLIGAVIGVLLALISGLYGFAQLSVGSGVVGRVGEVAIFARKILIKLKIIVV